MSIGPPNVGCSRHSQTNTTMHPRFAVTVLFLLGDFCITSGSSEDHEQPHPANPQHPLGLAEEYWEGRAQTLHERKKRQVRNEDIEMFREVMEKLRKVRNRPWSLETVVPPEGANFKADWEFQVNQRLKRSGGGGAGNFRKTTVSSGGIGYTSRFGFMLSPCRMC